MEQQPVRGWRTSEFWLTLLAVVVSAVAAAGVIPESHPWAKAIAILGAVLASLGYTVARSGLKKGPPTAAIALVVGALLLAGCCSTATCYLGKALVAVEKVDEMALVEIGKRCLKEADVCKGKVAAECPGWNKCDAARLYYSTAVNGVESHLAIVNRVLHDLGVP